MVYDFGNRPISNCNVHLDDRHWVETDINGRFSIAKVPAGDYKIQITKKGYETYTGKVHINDKQQVVYIRTPSLQQLLDLADNALERNNPEEALAYIQRALSINNMTTELLFYAAVVEFRLGYIREAADLLQEIKSSGVRDIYIERFLQDIQNFEGVKNEN
jgi:tetratricopeptide (TPR) repeat protein